MDKLKDFKYYEYFLNLIFIIIGILLFFYQSNYGWGFLIAGIITKERIYWGVQNQGRKVILLALFILAIPFLAIWLLISYQGALGYLGAILFYFVLRRILKAVISSRSNQ